MAIGASDSFELTGEQRRFCGQSPDTKLGLGGDLRSLIDVRWATVVGQAAVLIVVQAFMKVALPLGPLLSIIAIEVAVNAAVLLWSRARTAVRPWIVLASIGLDILALTGMLYFTSGPFNPFFLLYVVHIALAMLVLRTVPAWPVIVLSLACLGALFAQHRWLGIGWDPRALTGPRAMALHSQATWTVFAAVVAFMLYVARRIRADLEARQSALIRARADAARQDWFSSLATVTAGAAHDLAGPLSVIAVAARELERELAKHGATACYSDAKLIRDEVERCRAVLTQMADDLATAFDDGEEISAGALLAKARETLEPHGRVRFDVDPVTARCLVRVPVRLALQALHRVVRNGWQSMPDGGEIVIRAARSADVLEIEVEDSGAGMEPAILARATDPLFTTKAQSGDGMGLGLFLTRVFFERARGSLALQSVPGRGTVVLIQLPLVS